MRVRNFRFLALLLLLGLLSLFTGCNLIDKDVNPTEQRNNPVIVTNDEVVVLPGGRALIDLFKNDKITTSANVTLLKDYLQKGTAEFIKQGVVLYTAQDSSGIDTLAYTICVPGQPCDTGAVKITITTDTTTGTCAGAVVDFAKLEPGQTVDLNVLANDQFCDSTTTDSSDYTVDIIRSPTQGTAVVNGPFVIYTAKQDFQGADWMIYGARRSGSNSYVGYGIINLVVGNNTSNPDSCTIRAVADNYTLNVDSMATGASYYYFDVLANDSLCTTNTQYEVVGSYANISPTFENGKLKLFLNRPTSTTDSVGVTYKLTRGNQTSQTTVLIGFTGNVFGCNVVANNDSYTVSGDTLNTNSSGGQYLYFDVLQNDELCNQTFDLAVTNTGGLNEAPVFENSKLKVKLFPTDGNVVLNYALKEDGVIKTEAQITINVTPCNIVAVSDSTGFPIGDVATGGGFKIIDILANDKLCNYSLNDLSLSIASQNTNAFFENGKLKVFIDKVTKTYEIMYVIQVPTGTTVTETRASVMVRVE